MVNDKLEANPGSEVNTNPSPQPGTDPIKEARREIQEFFDSGQTLDVGFRLQVLQQLYYAVRNSQEAILQALHEDLNKSPHEGYMTEVGLVLGEISAVRKHLKKWARPKKVRADRSQFPAQVYIYKEPYGAVLVMSPWNYPFLLSLDPVVEAIAAGNTVLLKPSAYSPATSALLKNLLEHSLPKGLVRVVEGGRQENQALLDEQFDYIFFTGSPKVGHLVMAKASEHLTPVTLELGGKSPTLIDESADLELTAKRLAFGKLTNAGQTCVAPDYVLIPRELREEFISLLEAELAKVSKDAKYYQDNYPKIINQKQYDRLQGLLQGQKIIYGGKSDPLSLKIEPTLVLNPDLDSPLMQEEIFGPILPILDYEKFEDAIAFIKARPKPLALYHFTQNLEREAYVNSHISFGGGCINDCLLHLSSHTAPFGGVGNSGFGKYHGQYGFDEFSHSKTVLKKGKILDLSVRYHPYKKRGFRLLKRVLR